MTGMVDAQTLATEHLACSREKVYRMANAGEIPFVKVGRVYRFDPVAVREKLTPTPRSWAQSSRSTGRRRAA